jgi:hypothetical protein
VLHDPVAEILCYAVIALGFMCVAVTRQVLRRQRTDAGVFSGKAKAYTQLGYELRSPDREEHSMALHRKRGGERELMSSVVR